MSCQAITKTGTQCKNKAKENGKCGIHKSFSNSIKISDLIKDKEGVITNLLQGMRVNFVGRPIITNSEVQEIKESHTDSNELDDLDVPELTEENKITNLVTPFPIDPKFFGMETVFQNIEGTLALFRGKFTEEKMAMNAYESIKNLLVVNPPIKSPYGIAKQNRSVGFTSDFSVGYNYGGKTAPAIPLSEQNRILLEYVNKMLGSNYNAILWNQYVPKTDYLSAHSDNEDSLGNTGVFSITLWIDAPKGTSKPFRIRNKPLNKDKDGYKRITDKQTIIFADGTSKEFEGNQIIKDVELEHLDTCLMAGDFQKKIEHEIPKRLKVNYTRVSATFRTHLI